MDSLALLIALVLSYIVYRKYNRISLTSIPGPKPESFLLGIRYLHMFITLAVL